MGEAFTPGPWSAKVNRNTGYLEPYAPFVIKDSEWNIAVVLGDATALGRAAEANARLIAAAPMMFGVLKWISEHYENQDMGHKDFRVEAAIRADAAIRKATQADGETT